MSNEQVELPSEKKIQKVYSTVRAWKGPTVNKLMLIGEILLVVIAFLTASKIFIWYDAKLDETLGVYVEGNPDHQQALEFEDFYSGK